MTISESSQRESAGPEALHERLDAIYSDVLEDLTRLVAVPSVAWPNADPRHVADSAALTAELAEEVGFDTVEILHGANSDGSEGYPAVVARRAAPEGQPTVLLYAHHDVQPAGSREDWDTSPFELTVKGDRAYGRGSADDKAGILVHLTALRLLADELNIGVTLFVEGEEEAGSPSFRDFIERYRDRLAADVIIVADSGNWAEGTPALTTSLRGMAALEFTVRTMKHSVHSGMYGGVAPDAPLALIRLLSSLHREDGSPAVEGLVASEEVAVDYNEDDLRRDCGVLPDTRFIGKGPLASRLWAQPALTIIGIDMPSVADSSNTLHARAGAKVSMRLAPGQDPEDALNRLREHLEAHAPFGAQIEFGASEYGSPWRADESDPILGKALEALTDGFGTDAVKMGLGGSIPFIADLLDVFPKASILVTGIEDPDTRAHSANESLYLPDFKRAIVAEALLLRRLGEHV